MTTRRAALRRGRGMDAPTVPSASISPSGAEPWDGADSSSPTSPPDPAPVSWALTNPASPWGAPLETFTVDLRPLEQQPWLWVEAGTQDLRFRPVPLPPVMTVDDDEDDCEDDDALAALTARRRLRQALLSDDAYQAYVNHQEQAVRMWRQRPLVWRRIPQGIQVVLYGAHRFTWSLDRPQGLWESWTPLGGWSVDLSTLWASHVRDGVPARLLINPIAHHAQRDRDRRSMWKHTAPEGSLAWSPCLTSRDEFGTLRETVQAPSSTLDQALREVSRELARLHPFWRVIVQAFLHRSALHDHLLPVLLVRLPMMLAQWDAWTVTVREHPRANRLLAEALLAHLPPGQHTWRPDVWPTPVVRPVAWRLLRTGPQALVAAVSRGPLDLRRLDVWEACGSPSVPPSVLRLVPTAVWNRAHQVLMASAGVKDALRVWQLRRIKIFLDAARHRPWVEQGIDLAGWLANAQPVLAWATSRVYAPEALDDPSAGWNALVKAWLATGSAQQGWSVPFHTWSHRGVTFTAVHNLVEWAWLGHLLANCLRDGRSQYLRTLAENQKGLLLHVQGNGRSSVAFVEWVDWDHDEPPTWATRQHFASANTSPPTDHGEALQDVVGLLNLVTTPTAVRPAEERAAWQPYLPGFLSALTPGFRATLNDPSAPRTPWGRLRRRLGDAAGTWKTRQVLPLPSPLCVTLMLSVALLILTLRSYTFRQVGVDLVVLTMGLCLVGLGLSGRRRRRNQATPLPSSNGTDPSAQDEVEDYTNAEA